jgi:hypothetical protein
MQNGTYGLCFGVCKRKEEYVLGGDSEKRSDRPDRENKFPYHPYPFRDI